jgi:L-aspartate oxidase
MDLEFMQFHPTALVLPGAPSFLISEAVRGEGAILRDGDGHAFMADYHPARELAPRDVVARAIHQQMKRTNSDHVWLDMTHMPAQRIELRFPSIVRFCRAWEIDPVYEPVPVAPAAHYLMGGVRTDSWGRTTLPGLFACGEVACTGVHGANRLASNSLLEGLVFARRAVRCIEQGGYTSGPFARGQQLSFPSVAHLQPDPPSWPRLATAMWQHASLVRSKQSLLEMQAILKTVDNPRPPTATRSAGEQKSRHETANLALVAELLVAAALLREESRGAHYRADFPRHDPDWHVHSVISREGAWAVPAAKHHRELLAAGHA